MNGPERNALGRQIEVEEVGFHNSSSFRGAERREPGIQNQLGACIWIPGAALPAIPE
jgi:hypothetical protein